MAEPPAPTGPCKTGFFGLVGCGAGTALNNEGQSANALFAAIAGSFGSFGVQLLAFMILRMRLSRIYRPRSYLVAEKERVPIPPGGLFGWLVPLFKTSNLAFIQKCGLDAYFFLRYLQMLLKIFFPIALVVLPILLPINAKSGEGAHGLDRLAISNVAPQYRENRLWAHLLLAVGVVLWVCYVVYRELRGYIRVRQAFLTSPEHRIRASATTVLVTGIPRKWLTLEALNGLYDVFPGGIRNIWINRNFDELADKVQTRDALAKSLETAETNLIKLCRKKHMKAEKQKRKDAGKSKETKKERQKAQNDEDQDAEQMAQGNGTSVGDQHNTPHGLQDMLHDVEEDEKRRSQLEARRHNKTANPLGLMGEGFGAIGGGIGNLGKGVLNFGRNVVGDVGKEFHEAHDDTEKKIHRANMGQGFVTDDELYRNSQYLQDSVPPTPPPKSPGPSQDATQRVQFDGTRDAPRVATVVPSAGRSTGDRSPASGSDGTLGQPTIRMTGPSMESTKPRSAFHVQEPESHQEPVKKWQVWKKQDRSIPLPSPQPHAREEDEFPLNVESNRAHKTPDLNEKPQQSLSGSKFTEKIMFWKSKRGDGQDSEPYPDAHNAEWDEDPDGEPYWRRYIEPKDRETKRLPVICPSWFPSLPLVGPKVDKIYWLRRELAKLNLEIEMDQADVEKFPFMNSAFIQFNHQVAAHMACQSVTHHVPQHMAPRLVEISPDDVLWDNMSIKWWERYLRTGVVLAISAALIVFYAIPVTFTSLLSKLSTIAEAFPNAFGWLVDLPDTVQAILQGILPPVLLAVILALVPIIFRLLVKQQGVPTGNSKELGVQKWYFAFLFIQVFLVVTIAGGLMEFISAIANNPSSIVQSLARNLPKAANYFFSYLMVQALSISASNLLQVAALAMWFLLGPILDSTARAKWRRQTTLARVQWGSFFPPFTNFAVIGIIYSTIAPLILVFMLIIFALFWVVYRYNVLYVYQFRNDTGGLLFPTAVNQLFVGLYVMELCLVGYFFISTNDEGQVVCAPQAGIMIVCLVFTVLFQWILKSAFKPLFQYLPITLEDEAVIRDEEFARAQASKFAPLRSDENDEDDGRDIQDILEDREQREAEADERAAERERQTVEEHRRSNRYSSTQMTPSSTINARGWHQRGADRWRRAPGTAMTKLRHAAYEKPPVADGNAADPQTTKRQDVEAQKTVGDVLFSGFADELEDLTPEERDLLVRYAFQHTALRAKRPVVWIPRDKLGVSDDEIRRAKRMSTVSVRDGEKGMVEKTNIWMSNEGTALDGKGRVVFRRSPPDFSNVDLIAL